MRGWNWDRTQRFARLAARSAALNTTIPEALAQAVLDGDPEAIALNVHFAVGAGVELPELVLGRYRGLTRAQPEEVGRMRDRLVEACSCLEATKTYQDLLDQRRAVAAGGGL